MGTTRVQAARESIMWQIVSLALLATTTSLPSRSSFVYFGSRHHHGGGHRFGGGYSVSHSVHRVPHCIQELEEVEKEVCRFEPEKKCETKTQEYEVITGYEKGECKEIEVCKRNFYHKREARGYGRIECEKEKKEVCKREPTVEKKSKDFEVCRIESNKKCEMKKVKVPVRYCEEIDDKKDRKGKKDSEEREGKEKKLEEKEEKETEETEEKEEAEGEENKLEKLTAEDDE